MTVKEIKIVLGSTFGDEGKGATVQWLCQKAISENKSVAVLRFSGGPQAAHTVRHNGIEHICSSFGSGVLLDVPTIYYGKESYIDPICLKNEVKELKSKGINPILYFSSLYSKPTFITPYDVVAGRCDEETLKHGSCGKGINAARIRAEHGWSSSSVIDNLIGAETYYDNTIKSQVSEELKKEYSRCHKWLLNKFTINPCPNSIDVLIVEGTQGLLLDEKCGFNPHTTPSDVSLSGAIQCIKSLIYDNVPKELYLVTRTYTTRHGNGYEPKYPINIPEWKNESNVFNEFQGNFKTGILEIPLIQRAFDRSILDYYCTKFNITPNLVVTHTDLIESGDINKFYVGNDSFKSFNSVNEALNILIDELDSYLPIQKVYYSNNPDSNFKEFV